MKNIVGALLAVLLTGFIQPALAYPIIYTYCQQDTDGDTVGYGNVGTTSDPSCSLYFGTTEIGSCQVMRFGQYCPSLIPGENDNCPAESNTDQLNTDGDAQGDVCDADDDNDGVADTGDAFPLDNTQAGDIDADGSDGFFDNCPSNVNADQLNTDGDAQGDACDADDDNDGVADANDAFPLDPTLSGDSDSDGQDDLFNDNCKTVANADQLNTDGDAQGEACDADDDNDGVADAIDDFPLDPTRTNDVDGDGVDIAVDNCPSYANADQLNTDGDAQGDACDTDDDNDGVADTVDDFPLDPTRTNDVDGDGVDIAVDNCPAHANANQLNTDGDASGNICDADDDNDGVTDADEAALGTDPLDATSNLSSLKVESFENGLPAGWVKPASANAAWNITNAQASYLTRSFRSGVIGNSAKAQMDFTVNVAGNVIWLDMKTSTESADVFRVYVDGVGKLTRSGETAWELVSIPVTPGIHTVRLEYAKDASRAVGSDTVWIDNIRYLDGTDTDADGQRDGIDADDDNDGYADIADNCALLSNADQLNGDGDAQGNVCDSDDDNDGVVDTGDAFPLNATESADTDGDGLGNNADPDDDNDGLPDAMDPLPLKSKFNLNAPYKGSAVKDHQGVQ